jgi:hypothetical protein
MTNTLELVGENGRGTENTRFNALRHGVLSRFVVLPWEEQDEYGMLLDSLVAEHQPCGPTEEHLVEELAGIFWRKRRLRLAEAADRCDRTGGPVRPVSQKCGARARHLRLKETHGTTTIFPLALRPARSSSAWGTSSSA